MDSTAKCRAEKRLQIKLLNICRSERGMIKQYIKLFVITNSVLLFYALGVTWEDAQVEEGVDYYGGFFNLTFVIAILFFTAIYGAYSYAKTKSIILPNLMLLVHLVFYWSWVLCFVPRSKKTFDAKFLIDTSIGSLRLVGISVFFGLLTMLIIWVSKRKSQQTEKQKE